MPDLTLVTGASSDIGMELLRTLLETTDGRLIAHGFRGVDRFDSLIGKYGDRIVPLQADLSNPEAVLAFADQVGTYGTPTSIVHLPAPRLAYERFTKMQWAALEADFSVQLRSAMILLQRFLPKMTKLPRARVLFMLSSVTLGVPPKFMAQYTISKYAQLGLMRALAAEYAATPVRVNAVSPSMVDTQFLSELPELAVQGAAASHPMGRNATCAQIVGALAFLLSPLADYISGVALPVTGGTAV